MKTLKSSRKVTTVWLEPDVREGKARSRMFYCFNCKVPVIQYTGKVVTVLPGDQPYHPSTILKCKGSIRRNIGKGRDRDDSRMGEHWEECGQFYCFVGSVFTKNPQL